MGHDPLTICRDSAWRTDKAEWIGTMRGVSTGVLEKSGADVEAQRCHTEGSQQADAAKQCYDFERTNIGSRLGCLTHQSVCNDRIHGILLLEFGCHW